MEEKDMLDRLYCLFQESAPYRKNEAEICQTQKALLSLLEDSDKEKAVLDYGIAYEKAGFRNGFILAVQIMTRCIIDK